MQKKKKKLKQKQNYIRTSRWVAIDYKREHATYSKKQVHSQKVIRRSIDLRIMRQMLVWEFQHDFFHKAPSTKEKNWFRIRVKKTIKSWRMFMRSMGHAILPLGHCRYQCQNPKPALDDLSSSLSYHIIKNQVS